MKHTKLAMSMLCALASIAGIANAQPAGYDFSYSASGDKRAVPFQVFDDGKETFFQFKSDDAPAIFVVHGSQRQIVQAKKSGMYVVVDGVQPEYILQVGDFTATVKKAGMGNSSIADESNIHTVMNDQYGTAEDKKMTEFPNRVEFAPKTDWDQPVNVNAEKKAVASESQDFYVPFAKGATKLGKLGKKKVDQIAEGAKGAIRIEVRGGADSSSYSQSIMRAISIQDALVAKGIKEDKIVVSELPGVKSGGKNIFLSKVTVFVAKKQDVKPESVALDSTSAKIMQGVKDGVISPEDAARMMAAVPQGEKAKTATPEEKKPEVWVASKSMGSVKSVISDWANKAGWQLSWEIQSDYPIIADANFSGSFTDAVTSIAKSMENNQLPIRVIFYDQNKVLRIVAAGGE